MQNLQTEYAPRLMEEIEKLCVTKLSIRISSRDQDLFETGLLDSLSLVQLILELEQHFQLELPMGELDLSSLRSVDEMARLIVARRAGRWRRGWDPLMACAARQQAPRR